jgi:hypothetical protein
MNQIVADIGKEKIELIPVIEETEKTKEAAATKKEIAKKYEKEILEMIKLEGVLKPSGMNELIYKIYLSKMMKQLVH